jgi:hypothetical protein
LNGYLESGNSIIRGVAGQFRMGVDVQAGGIPMLLGMEIRPEYDHFMGVFRLPVTLSWGFNDKFRVFLGPAFSFGDAAISTPAGNRGYVGGTNIIGTIGISAAPFSLNVSGGDLAPYAELAWQSYASSSSGTNLGADFAASIRFSAGIRYTWKFRK